MKTYKQFITENKFKYHDIGPLMKASDWLKKSTIPDTIKSGELFSDEILYSGTYQHIVENKEPLLYQLEILD